MARATIGLIHPGEMGSSLGDAASGRARVLWASKDRSPATRARAEAAGLSDAGTLEALVAASRVILSVCPPHGAPEQARAVARLGFTGLYVDANAVSPASAREIGRIVEAGGASFVDGGIVGPPARRRGTTRLYLAGGEADRVARLFEGSPLEAIVLDGPAGSASALKVCFAAYTKGSAALLAAIRALAVHEGVEEALLGEWERSLPELPGRSEGSARVTAPRAWRFVAEMDEIADGFASAGLPTGFHRAAAQVYGRLGGYKDCAELPSLERVVATLLGRR